MNNLLILIAAVFVTVAFYALRRSTLQHQRTDALAFVCLWCLSLGLALRFGGRTYPGIYYPNSPFLNDVLNGNGLFVSIGYSAVLIAGTATTLQIFARPVGQVPAAILISAKWVGVLLAIIISLYGFYWAAILQRIV